MKTSKADNKKVKDIIRKAKGLSRKQAEILATIPPNVLYTLINTMSQLVSQNEPELKEGKLVARAREQVSFVLKKLEDEIHRRIKKDNLGFGARSWRYAAVINNGEVEKMFAEEGKCDNHTEDPYEISTPENVYENI